MQRSPEKRISSFYLNTRKRRSLAATISFIACLSSQCVFNGSVNEEPLTLKSLDANGDTLSVFPRLRFVFSSPLADTSVPVVFSPAVSAGYGVHLNAIRDTLTVDIMEMLEGNTRYVFRLGRDVTSIDGIVGDMSDDSTVFYTYPCEQESNDTKSLADTLTSIIFGSISDVSDVDIFTVIQKDIHAVYLQSIDCRDSFYIEDGLANVTAIPGPIRQADTITLPENDTIPVFIVVRSGIKGFEGNYELGVIGR